MKNRLYGTYYVHDISQVELRKSDVATKFYCSLDDYLAIVFDTPALFDECLDRILKQRMEMKVREK